jgi:hypothetical protein
MFLDTSRDGGRSKGVLIGVTVTFVFATLFVAARLISRLAIAKYRSWDDFFIVVAWVGQQFLHWRWLVMMPETRFSPLACLSSSTLAPQRAWAKIMPTARSRGKLPWWYQNMHSPS